MGWTVTTKTETKPSPQALPADLAAVALIDAATCAAAGAMSVSWWHEEVRAGRAPTPVIRKPRCTRWRVADVHTFWTKFAEDASKDSQGAQAAQDRAKKASQAAQAKRAAAAAC
jgi:hypothetical protein